MPQDIEELEFSLYAGKGCWWLVAGSCFCVQKRLQDERGGYLVDYAAMLLAGVARFVEDLMRFAGSQPLVPQVNGEASQHAQFGGKGLGFDGLGAGAAGQMHWVAYHDAHDAKAAAESRQRAQVVAAVALALQRQNRLRGQAQLVRDSHADAAVADVEAEIARIRGGLQRLAPGF